MTPAPRVAVIGAGASGLLAALRLRQLGLDVTVFEASSQAGGVLQSVRRDGWLAERGANTLSEPHPEVRTLLDGVGLAEILIRPAANMQRRYLVHRGVPVAVPSRVADLVSSPLLSLAGRLRLLKEPFTERGTGDDEESVDAFVRRRLGAEVADAIIDPLLAGTSTGEPEQLLARFVFPKLVEYERTAGSILKGAMRSRRNARRRGGGGGIWSCQLGMGQLIERIVANLGGAVCLNAPVHSLLPVTDGIEVTVVGNSPARFDGVVVAVPAPALGRMDWAPPQSEQVAQMAGMPHASMAVVSLGFRREDVGHPLDGTGLLVATAEQRRILSVIFPSSLFEGRAPVGQVLLTTHVGGARQPGLVDLPDEKLLGIVLDELHSLLDVRGTPTFQDIFRWRGCLPQAVAGHAGRLAAADVVEESAPGLVLTGAWRDGLPVGEAMLGGVRAADRLLQHLSAG